MIFDNITTGMLLFYIAGALVLILLVLVYLMSRK